MGDAKKPSVEALREMRELHQSKLAKAELEKEAHIQKMLEELEGLRSEREQNKQLLGEAQATLNYYNEMEKNGKLDEEDLKNSADVKGLVSDLERQRGVINTFVDTFVDTIKANPEVIKKLKEKEAAELEAQKAERLKREAALKEETRKEFAMLAEKIKALGEEKYLLDKQSKDADDVEIEAREKVKEMTQVESDKLSEKSPVKHQLGPFDRQGSFNAYLSQLLDRRERLGFWDFSSKRAIDNILSQKVLFGAVTDAYDNSCKLQESLKPQYEKIDEDAKKLQEIYAETRWGRNSELVSIDREALNREFVNLLRSFADVDRPDPTDSAAKMRIGKYPDWRKARSDLKNAALYGILYRIDNNAPF
ncbi:hypothetical protein A2926_03725 [Candidatus Giovannonibacteria bacterium RIFCSPLOWO2_01_FULL_44_40]|uniref:Uncharacterized protein n=1 Tax=Candidatus Giovannonibacteria bacterium RIFCSPHIGHO2_01_FULL_45_23 TaxID=1798325 RepID=A0A1F5VIK0_9BACT|nr:MAG: hypothetical protein A2834_03820 [Candidatus Giovannonibacteria bacterium RIFCSPHIGHO2_01_FULL_45_23]OGF80244.1 MAG: hypothetical protein A2926_03725 [Candidatus Giovannonibacteria bacterium RIFCSPLOWO2_01_FULL_44_40]